MKKITALLLSLIFIISILSGCNVTVNVTPSADGPEESQGEGGFALGNPLGAGQNENDTPSLGESASESYTFEIMKHPEFGAVQIKTTDEEFKVVGAEFGDSLRVEFSNGYVFEDIPYYDGYYERVNKPLVVNYSGSYINIAFCSGYLAWDELGSQSDGALKLSLENPSWNNLGCQAGDTVTISINEKGKYLAQQEAMGTVYYDDRNLYESDEVFSNFRSMEGGDLKDDMFYRGASPVDNQRGRAKTSDTLLEKNGIKAVLDLADTDEKIKGYMAKGDYASDYAKSLYENNSIIPIALTASYRTDAFKESLAGGIREMMNKEGPYYIHCTEGKDRTGFVCMLFGALAGFSYDELEYDYMVTYDNYYGINSETEPEKYEALKLVKFDDMIWWLADVPDYTDLSDTDLSIGAKSYLLSAGMTDEEIESFRDLLTK